MKTFKAIATTYFHVVHEGDKCKFHVDHVLDFLYLPAAKMHKTSALQNIYKISFRHVIQSLRKIWQWQ